ncbi:hypothetical protein SISNIDRAFT_553455 [Sistotremastrum niveocremeum HHB9708]|uniref:DUF6535 domain-containing protein n=1 Tax=Sistotremastrum niveocremeum HHB9708 TaxID=1314777 RepID=A0A164MKA5_9AGAM|nr:hypothetical protein SISNIDRAFT_553455 [Sistotremastrum niveocremeum HHB9708]
MDTTLEAMLRDAQHVAPVYQPYLLCRRLASPVALTFPSPSSIPASLNMRSRKTSTNSSKESPVTTTKGDLAPRFDRLISLIEEQNKIMGEQGKTLKEHSTMLEALEKDATRDDKAYEGRSLKDELTWGALDKEALAKMKVAVDGWKDLMNVLLIFIALFLTVVTAFISPIIQLFSTPSSTNPSSSSSSKPPLPPTSLQLVALFYCLALMFSICNSVMCVLGLQWSGRLLSVPQGKTNLERTLNRERRKLLAEKRLLPLMSVLFWTLLLSIAFFVVDFLIQLWALSFSFEERASILIISAVAATALAITILGVILATTYHATIYENSPFESLLSSASITAWAWINQVLKKVKAGSKKRKDSGQRWHLHQPTISPLDRFQRRVQWTVGKLSRPPGPSRHESSRKAVEVIGKIESEQREEEPLEALMTEKAEDNENVKALKGYARLVINTNDTEVLERAVASFEITEWWKNGAELLPVFLAVRERFLATDTSFRVKETVTKRLSDCREWSGWRSKHGWRSDIEGNAITRWCRDHCNELVYRSRESHCQFFAAFVFFTSLDSNNKDLRKLPWEGSYEKSVVRVLSSFDQDQPYG